jgi:hypothetical protein
MREHDAAWRDAASNGVAILQQFEDEKTRKPIPSSGTG